MATCSGQPGLNSENLSQKKRALSPVSDLAHFIAGYYSNHIGVGYAICVCDVKALVTGKDTLFLKAVDFLILSRRNEETPVYRKLGEKNLLH